MKHLGDITKINGAEVPIVDVITGGSPCQDLSVAGKRAGLAGERSGLFMEQIRIIKEMRAESERILSIQKPNYDRRDIKPRYMVWENVQGAFSSNHGEDFRAVLEETAKVAQRDAVIPGPQSGKWTHSGCVMGNGWSIAWRLHDAQFWGVPQRRKRISLVADFGSESAPEILFERKGVSGNIESSESKGKEASRTVAASVGESGESTSYTLKIRGGSDTYIKPDGSVGTAGKGALIQKELSGTLGVSQDQTLFANCYSVDQGVGKSRRIVSEPILLESTQNHATVTQTGTCTTLTSSMGTGGGFVPMLVEETHQQTQESSNWDGTQIASTLTANNANGSQRMPDKENFNAVIAFEPGILKGDNQTSVVYSIENHANDCRYKIIESEKTQTLSARQGTGGNNGPLVQITKKVYDARGNGDGNTSCTITGEHQSSISDYTAIALETVGALCACDCKGAGNQYVNDGKLVLQQRRFEECLDEMHNVVTSADYKEPMKICNNSVVRRLTPMECERLQGYPDNWTNIGEWIDSKGKKHKDADSPRYKALGNSIALPFWDWLAGRMCDQLRNDGTENLTMASLFDGIGGFPFVYQNHGCVPVWASEIEEFPIAVTKIRFPDIEESP